MIDIWQTALNGVVTLAAASTALWLKARQDNKARPDSLAGKLFDAKLRVWPEMYATAHAVMTDAITRANQGPHKARPLPLEEDLAMRRAHSKHAHVLPDGINVAVLKLVLAADKLHSFETGVADQ